MSKKDYNQSDVDFVQMMIPHHQLAVDSAVAEYRDGQNPEIKQLCVNIVFSQLAEIEQMRNWLADREIAEKAPEMKM